MIYGITVSRLTSLLMPLSPWVLKLLTALHFFVTALAFHKLKSAIYRNVFSFFKRIII